ncbi:hypothetical protein C2845_PM18G13650 [Panicum miliaceum]|uniref:Uncharacterized protein n=1 Tax=Panicum miliaceum TaxID=4540 RepID=A0A3L6PI95_PANMI|nr:hypothetical protein C2845_PM18G13650 [Panicum miliaceum]
MAFVFSVGTMKDVEAMMVLPPNPPRLIEIVSLDSVRRAPEYLAAVQDKVGEGWASTTTPNLARFARFADMLTALDTDILPTLANNPTDIQALRGL